MTGAAAGIGAASARGAARRRLAESCCSTSRSRSSVARALRRSETALRRTRCDVADEDSVAAAFAAVDEQYGRVDVLHSNAGIFLGHGVGHDGPLDRPRPRTWQRTLDVNLTGAYLCSKHVLPLHASMAAAASCSPRPCSGALIGSAAIAYAVVEGGR